MALCNMSRGVGRAGRWSGGPGRGWDKRVRAELEGSGNGAGLDALR